MLLNGKTPSINQIRYFVAVAKYLSFRQAATSLGISQPTLTSQINTLEASLDLILFERSRTGTLLSPQGKALFEAAEEVLQANHRFNEIARDLAEGEEEAERHEHPQLRPQPAFEAHRADQHFVERSHREEVNSPIPR